MDQVYLKGRDGSRVGPLDPQWIEILYDARLLDAETPVSPSGRNWEPLKAWPELVDRIHAMRAAFARGSNPWSELAGRPAASGGHQAAQVLKRDESVLTQVLTLAVHRAEGRFSATVQGEPIHVDFRDGKVAQVTGARPRAFLERLIDKGIITSSDQTEAELSAPSFGGDVTTALVARGTLSAAVFLEELRDWALEQIRQLLLQDCSSTEFDPSSSPSVTAPLSFDRFGVYLEAVRGLALSELENRLLPKRRRPLILSSLDGVDRDALKLVPRELRILQSINGVRSLSDLLEQHGSDREKRRTVLHTVFFLTESGMVVWGQDAQQEADQQRAAEIRKQIARWQNGNHFEAFGVSPGCTNEQLEERWNTLRNEFHPDRLLANRPDPDPELVKAHEEAYSFLREIFQLLEDEDQRITYAQDLEEGRAATSQDLEKAQNVLRAETEFKKGEVLVRVKKYSEALAVAREAERLAPDEKDYQMFREYVEYLAQHGHRPNAVAAETTAKNILGIMKFDATLWGGYVYLAHLYKFAGKQDLSIKYYEKVLEFDEGHHEALQEVRLHRMRKEREKKKKKWF